MDKSIGDEGAMSSGEKPPSPACKTAIEIAEAIRVTRKVDPGLATMLSFHPVDNDIAHTDNCPYHAAR